MKRGFLVGDFYTRLDLVGDFRIFEIWDFLKFWESGQGFLVGDLGKSPTSLEQILY